VFFLWAFTYANLGNLKVEQFVEVLMTMSW